MATKLALKCPQCGELDAVRKVSAIYSSGHSTIPNNSPLVPYGVVDKTIATITPLAQKFTPPVRPNIQRPIGFKRPSAGRWFLFIAGNIFFILMSLGMAASGILTIWFIFFAFGGSNFSPELIIPIGLGIFGVVGVISLSSNVIKKIQEYRSGKTEQEFNVIMKNYTEKYNVIMSKYEIAKYRWDSAYYCGRCDGVFILGESEITPTNQFQRFINKYDF
jgi:hypothetical protein